MVERKFKHTDIGLIPEDWEVKYVKDFTDCTAGGTPSTKMNEYWNGDIPWMNSGELNKRKIYNTQNFITKRGLENSSTKIIPENCVLIGLAGQGKTRGTVAINKISLSINQSIGAFYPNSIYNYNYLFFNLQNRYEELRNLSSGDGGRGGLNLHILKNLQIPIPPLPEQQAIAEVLSDTDALIESLEKFIAKKQFIKQGAMQNLLTPKEDWEVKKLGEISEIMGAGVDKKINKNELSVTLLNYLDVYRRDYIFKNELHHIVTAPNSKIEQCNIRKGDILITPSSELSDDIGVTALAMEDMYGVVYSYHLYRIRFKIEIDWKFSLFIFKNRFFLNQAEKFAEGSGKRYVISLSKIRDFDIAYPKCISEQTRIATILSDMDTEIGALEQKLAKAKQIKQGLMQQLLTGKIRLVQSNDKKETKPAKGHNEYITDAVLIGTMASCFASEQFPLTRFKYTKVSYLLKRYKDEQTIGYLKKAAGPYKPQTRYGGAEKIAKQNKYVSIKQSVYKGKSYEGFISGENVDKAIDFFKKWYGEDSLEWIRQFKFETNDNLELWATVDMAVQDLKRENKAISLEAVKQVIKENKEWRDKLKRPAFSDKNIKSAIGKIGTLYT